MHWMIAIPAWGDKAVNEFIHIALPSVHAGLTYAKHTGVFIIHTDQAERVRRACAAYDLACHCLPPPNHPDKYARYSLAQREAFTEAGRGPLFTLTADGVASYEAFAACARRFNQGKRLILVHSPRAILSNRLPRPDIAAPQLCDWICANMHPAYREREWGTGCAIPPSIFVFRGGDDITVRAFHMHPLAVFVDRDLDFKGTPDWGLPDLFLAEEIHVITDRNELAAVSLDPEDATVSRNGGITDPQYTAGWMKQQLPVHWWLSTHRIIMRGAGNTDDRELWNQMLCLANPDVWGG